MVSLNSDPRTYGLPHSSWRPNQLQFLQGIEQKLEDGSRFIFGELPTGSGKSAVPTALGKDNDVLVLTKTLGLLDQYEREYGFSIIKGKQEYQCVLPDKTRHWKIHYNKIPTAADCHLDRMQDCAYADRCPYLQARERVKNSSRAACTYRYASVSEEMKKRPGLLVLDEAHHSAEEILSLSEFKITSEQVDEYNLPDFPINTFGADGKGDLIDDETRGVIMSWLLQCGLKVGRIDTLDFLSEEGARQKGFARYIDRGIKLLESEDDLFLYSGDDKTVWSPYPLQCITLKPLSVVNVINDIWSGKDAVILMSATIGQPAPLAQELGITAFDSMTFPHPVPVDARPIYDLGVDKMTWENMKRNPNLSKIQALLIAKFIESLDPDWRGIVLTTSNAKINFLREYLGDKFPTRVMKPSQKAMHSVTKRIDEFINCKNDGIIAIDTIQGWGSGLDLRYDLARFAIVAGVPFLNPSERYDVLRSERPGGQKYGLWNTFNAIVQASGRVSRGERENNEWMLNVSALADGSATSPVARAFYPAWYRNAIR